MNILLIFACLFAVGSFLGWGLEVLFRGCVSKKWINPGFLTGPYLPIYGFSLCVLYLLTMLEEYIPLSDKTVRKIVLFLLMALCITIIEYAAGLIFIKKMKIKLWDYSDMRWNFQGIICPLFSLFWLILSALYYFLIHPHILDMLVWLSRNLAFSFCIGLYFGIMIMDFAYSSQIISHIKHFAEEQHIIVRLEELKEVIQETRKKRGERFSFMFAYKSKMSVREHLEHYMNSPDVKNHLEEIRRRIKKR